MALKKTVETRHGFIAQDAYISIGHVESLNKTSMSFTVNYRKEKDAQPFDAKTFSCAFDVEGQNPYAQAYNFMKTLTEFSGAQDC